MAVEPAYIGRVIHDEGVLTFEMTDGARPAGRLRFEFVRAHLFVKESDFWPELSAAEGVRLFDGADDAPNVVRLTESILLGRVLGDRLAEEKPELYRLWTPDECYEIATFQAPEWFPAPAEAGS